jgi:F-box-like
LPVEVIELIFSFCDGKDLLRLAETCTKFKDIVAQSTRLMKKLRIVIDVNLKPADREAILQCINSRRFSAARLEIIDLYDDNTQYTNQLEILSIAERLEGIKDLTINGNPLSFNIRQVIQITSQLLPQAKICKIKCISYDSDTSSDFSYEFSLDHSVVDDFQLQQCDFLTDLQADNCDPVFLSRVLLEAKNLKRLSIETSVDLEEYTVKGTSVWKIVNFKLETIELSGIITIGDTFLDFLANQTELRSLSIERSDIEIKTLFEINPQIKSFNVGLSLSMELGNIPLDQLHKLRVWKKDEFDDQDVFCQFASNAPNDVCAFESNFMEFLNRDTSIAGLKNSEVITHIKIGNQSWINAGVTVSDGFIPTLIRKSRARSLEIWTSKTMEEIDTKINMRNKNYPKLVIHGTDGVRIFNSHCDSDNEYSETDESYIHF